MGESELHFVPEKRLVIIRRMGDIGLDDLLRGVGDMFDDPRILDCDCVLSDLREARLTATGDEMGRHAQYCREKFEGHTAKIAIVALREADYGIARMFEQLSDLPLVSVYYSIEEAYAWFDLDYETSDCPSWESA